MNKDSLPKSTILVPLYVYPAPGAWEPLYEVITSYPGLDFTIVVNPHSGPGPRDGPDANYSREIPLLNSYANVRTVGYVATGYANRELAAVLQDITTYAAWSKNATPGLELRGIFFDETPSQYEPRKASFLDTLHAAVRSEVGFGSQCMIIDNPGTLPDSRHLGGADVTVVFEGGFDTYRAHNLGHAIMELQDGIANRTQLACIMHSLPETIEEGNIKNLVRELRKLAGNVFVTELSVDYYSSFGTSWKSFVAEMDWAA